MQFIWMRKRRRNLIVCSIILLQSSSKPDTFPDNSTEQHRESTNDGLWIGLLLGIIPACILGCLAVAFIFLDKKSKITYGLTNIQLILYYQCRRQVILSSLKYHQNKRTRLINPAHSEHFFQNITHLYRFLLFMK